MTISSCTPIKILLFAQQNGQADSPQRDKGELCTLCCPLFSLKPISVHPSLQWFNKT